jgi:hypothetical protein
MAITTSSSTSVNPRRNGNDTAKGLQPQWATATPQWLAL